MIYAVSRVLEMLRTYDSPVYFYSREELHAYIMSINEHSPEVRWVGIHIDEIDIEGERWEGFEVNRYNVVIDQWRTTQEWIEHIQELVKVLR